MICSLRQACFFFCFCLFVFKKVGKDQDFYNHDLLFWKFLGQDAEAWVNIPMFPINQIDQNQVTKAKQICLFECYVSRSIKVIGGSGTMHMVRVGKCRFCICNTTKYLNTHSRRVHNNFFAKLLQGIFTWVTQWHSFLSLLRYTCFSSQFFVKLEW